MMKHGILIFGVLAMELAAAAALPEVASPDGKVAFHLEDGNTLLYSVTVDGSPVVDQSRLGLVIDGADLGEDAKAGAPARGKIDETFPVMGKKAEARNDCNTAVFPVKVKGGEWSLEVRVFNDGVGFRYLVPGSGRRVLSREKTAFRLPSDAKLWFAENGYESPWVSKTVSQVADGQIVHFPAVAELAGGRGYGLVSDSMAVDYLACGLKAAEGTFEMEFKLEKWFQDKLEIDGTIKTPWRVVMVNRDLNGLVSNTLVQALADAPKGDFSWVKPGRSGWAWLSGGYYGQNLQNMKDQVEQCQKLGWEYMIVDDGWEQEWQPLWEQVKELCDFARERNVKIILWKPTFDGYAPKWRDSMMRDGKKQVPIDGLFDPVKRTAFFENCAKAGVAGLKVDFIGEGNLKTINYHRDILELAAKHRMVVDFHGCTKPSGLERTWPNELTREAIRGGEEAGKHKDFYKFSTIYPFTRFVIGPADYTPLLLQKGAWGTIAHQFATLVVFNSPLNALSCNPKRALESPASEFLKACPTVWDETVVLEPSRIGEVAVIARRSGTSWFLGAVNGETARKIKIDCAFLGAGSWRMTSYSDADRFKETRTVSAKDTLDVELAVGGGYAAQLIPAPAAPAASAAPASTVWLDSLDLSVSRQGWGSPQKNKSVGGQNLSIGGKPFEHGFGTHAPATLVVMTGGGARKFTAEVGLDDEVGKNAKACVEFRVLGDGKELWTSGVMRAGDAAKPCEVNLSGVKTVTLEVGDADDGLDFDHADWADARFEIEAGAKLMTLDALSAPSLPPYILTPPAPAAPRINGPGVFGVRPGSPFLYAIPATGERPMTIAADGLPEGLKVDAATGRITGNLTKRGESVVTLRAKNARGAAERKFRIVCGDKIALTPPMGWNSWNCFTYKVSTDNVKRAADAFVKSGLVNHGWSYINIDDFWQNHLDPDHPAPTETFRDQDGFIRPNKGFPDMKELADYVHGLGLKIGLYSSPGPWTCGGCAGSFGHEKQDAETYAKWGFDYLKYDWCSYGQTDNRRHWPDAQQRQAYQLDYLQQPYDLMGRHLAAQPRDIVYSLCQYGMGDVWKWGGSVGGQCWRTTGDIIDTWESMSGIGFRQDEAAPYAKPGNWTDPDMLVVGLVGWGQPRPTRLTTDEQYTHISLWCLLSAPLLIGCDLEKLDDFTLSLLTNDEVLAVDQDALGKQATCVISTGDLRVYAKELEDGSRAVGFFNIGVTPLEMKFAEFAKLGVSGSVITRDLWRQQDIATLAAGRDTLPLTIPAHGVVMCTFRHEK